MINKIYEQAIIYIKEFKWFIIFFFLFLLIENIYLPYYVEAPGGLTNISNKLVVENASKSVGSFNMAYVSEYKVNILMYLYTFLNDDFDLIKMNEADLGMKPNDADIRNRLMMDSSINNAIIVAFNYSNNYYEIKNKKVVVSYISVDSETNLEVGDELLEIGGRKINDLNDISTIVNKSSVGSFINVKVKKDNNVENKTAKVYEIDNKLYIGISIETLYDIETNKEVVINIEENEVGPSGGLMMALSLYDSLVDEDITKGYKIAGTGTITSDGNVGEIGGVEYKIKGAVQDKADVFLVPNENYIEAKSVVENNNYDLKVVNIGTFEEAITFLKSLD